MKKLLAYLLLALMILPLSCKKGENDPSLSLRTRKGRLTGVWNMVAYSYSSDLGDISTIEFDPNDGLVYTTQDSMTYSREYSWEINFDSDGSYTSKKKETFPEDSAAAQVQYTLNSSEKGIWEFTGGNDSPSKSRLALFAEEVSSTRTDQGSNIIIEVIDNPVNAFVYDIDRLTNTDLWLKYTVVITDAFDQRTESLELKFTKAD